VAIAAEARGWRVRGLARPGSPTPVGPRAPHIVRGTPTSLERVRETVAGARAVCCALGPRAPHTEVFCARATAAILRAMEEAGCRRLVCQTGAMIGPAGSRSWAFERLARAFARRAPEAARDRVEQEWLVEESGLEWTIVKPPRLTDGPAAGRVRVGTAVRVGLLSSIRRADLAAFIMDEIETPRFLRARVFVKG
jgi:putative NADH-flavin reductase